jgi:hypothetical protein
MHLALDALAQSRYLIASLVTDVVGRAESNFGVGSARDVRRVERAKSSRERDTD